MKKQTIIVFVVSSILFSCNPSSIKEVNEAKENLTEAKDELKDAKANEKEDVKAKEIAEWRHFKNEADSAIASTEKEIKKLDARMQAAGKTQKQELKVDYDKAVTDLETLKEKLHKQSVEFENDVKNFDNNVSEKNQSFKREFKHDMDEFGKSFKDLFRDNVK